MKISTQIIRWFRKPCLREQLLASAIADTLDAMMEVSADHGVTSKLATARRGFADYLDHAYPMDSSVPYRQKVRLRNAVDVHNEAVSATS